MTVIKMKINGKRIANKIFEKLKWRVKKLREKNIVPHLAVILVGKDPSSISYVNQKEIKGKKIGVKITVKNISTNITQSQLIKTIQQFNNDNNIHGIIVQRPLSKKINSNAISLAINPSKDVDGFHPKSHFKTPIALAVLKILERTERSEGVRLRAQRDKRGETTDNQFLRGEILKWLTSQKIVIIGKGQTGGKPIIDLFKKMGIEPQIIDSKTPNPQDITKKADIIISAVGKANIIRPEMIKREVILISVGLHKVKDGNLHGDYDEKKIKNTVSFYTPTPGGVGPLNVAMLLKNLVKAAESSIS